MKEDNRANYFSKVSCTCQHLTLTENKIELIGERTSNSQGN